MKSAEETDSESQQRKWKLLGCENDLSWSDWAGYLLLSCANQCAYSPATGLRFFQEVPSAEFLTPLFAKQLKVVKCVGVVDASAERACSLILDYGPLRNLWDSTVENAHVLDSRDGKTDILQLTMRSPHTSWWSKPAHLVLLRWWTRNVDGSYVIFFKAMPTSALTQSQCSGTPPSSWLDCGAYIIHPLSEVSESSAVVEPTSERPSPPMTADSSPRCVVELALETEESHCRACSWLHCCSTSPLELHLAPMHLTQDNILSGSLCAFNTSSNLPLRNAMFHSIAGLREFCKATRGGAAVTAPPHSVSHRSQAFHSPPALRMSRGQFSPELGSSDGLRQPLLLRKADSETNEESFEDCTVESLSDMASDLSESGFGAGSLSALRSIPSPDRVLSVQEQAYPCHIDWEAFHGSVRRGRPKQGDCRDSWTLPEGTAFMVRGETFRTDGAKAVAGPPLCQIVAVDWFHAKEPMHSLARRKGSLVQRVREHYEDGAPFFVVLNLQIPAGSKGHYSLLFYFATSARAPCLQPGSLLHKFINAEDEKFRKQSLTLIPAIPVGSWIIRNAVGSERFVMLAEVLSTKFVRGEGFLEMDVNMGTSSVVSGIMGLVIPCMSVLTVDMAFFVKAEEGDQLPEELFGAVRCCNLEQGSAVTPPE